MTRRGTATTAVILALLTGGGGARAADRSDPLLAALEGELERSMEELRLPDAPPPYLVSYTLYDSEVASAMGSFGALLRSTQSRARPLRVDVRVGDYEVDNTNYSSFGEDPSGLGRASLVLDDDRVAVARDLWIVTDAAYKSAVEGLSTKRAGHERTGGGDRPPDYSRVEPTVRIEAAPRPAVDLGAMEELARELSARMAGHAALESSRAYASEGAWRRYLVTSEGTRVVDATSLVVVRVAAEARAPDGSLHKDTRSWIGLRRDDMPSLEQMRAETDAMVERLLATAGAEAACDYLGPVIFEDQAAAELFRQLLVPQLMGTPDEESGSDWSVGDGFELARIGRRVLPDGFAVVDDPASGAGVLPGGYLVDDEGVPARSVELVRDGVVRSLLMSRTPRDDLRSSNGHGRGSSDSRIVGMPGVMEVRAGRGTSRARLLRRAFKMARQSGLDHVLVVRVLDDPALVVGTAVRRIRLGESHAPALTDALEVVRLFADGREEPVRGGRFLLGDHRVLRDVVAATAEQRRADYLAPAVLHGGTSWVSGPTSGIAVTLVAPAAVLVSEMELRTRSRAGDGPPPLLTNPAGEGP